MNQQPITQLSQIPIVPGLSLGTVYSNGSTIWNIPNSSSAPDGVPLIFSTVVNDTTGTLNVTYSEDDVAELYVDGIPRWITPVWYNGWSQSVQIPVTPGYHTVQLFAENTYGQNIPPNNAPTPAWLSVTVQDGNGSTLSSTANPSQWSVQQPVGDPATYNPYMFGSTTQQSPGAYDPSKSNSSGTSGGPIGPATLPQQ